MKTQINWIARTTNYAHAFAAKDVAVIKKTLGSSQALFAIRVDGVSVGVMSLPATHTATQVVLSYLKARQ